MLGANLLKILYPFKRMWLIELEREKRVDWTPKVPFYQSRKCTHVFDRENAFGLGKVEF